MYKLDISISHLAASKKDGSGKTHLLSIHADNWEWITLSHSNNIYSNDISLCGLDTTDKGYIKNKDTITCERCLCIMDINDIKRRK